MKQVKTKSCNTDFLDMASVVNNSEKVFNSYLIFPDYLDLNFAISYFINNIINKLGLSCAKLRASLIFSGLD